MATKKNTKGTGGLQALRIGSRVRCTDDGVEGRIAWANAVAVKIKWDDGEQVTWKRDSLTERPIEILDPDEEGQAEAPAAPATETQAVPEGPADIITAGEPTTQPDPEGVAGEADDAPAGAPALNPVTDDLPAAAEQAPAFYLPPPEPGPAPAAPAPADEGALAVPAPPRRRPKAPAQPREKKVSALDAAARVLSEEGRPMTCKEMIDTMAARGYWSSPGGKTPEATLYSAILRELATKGDQARFTKVGRGQFAYRAGARRGHRRRRPRGPARGLFALVGVSGPTEAERRDVGRRRRRHGLHGHSSQGTLCGE
jgi:hypothetical protein